MNFMVITWIDATNLAIENIIREMVARGHQVEIFAYYMDNKSIRMFDGLNLPIHPAKEINKEVIERFDVAFCAESAMQALRYAEIYTFSYNNIPDTWVTDGSDFMFTMVRDRKLRWLEDCATMPIGVAKNDTPCTCENPKKQFLYIDAGHNPYGEKGKFQVANMLLEICRNFSEYDLVVKPRWLLGDKNQSHRSSLHIYNVLNQITNGQLPLNLVLLDEHRNLQELMDESVCVLTTSVSCYLDAAARGKGCIVIDGLDSEDSFESVSFKNIYASAKESGCCVNYDKVVEYLPAGIRCDPAHLKKRIPYTSGVSARIVDVIEYVYDNFVRYKKYPAIQQYDYESYQKTMSESQLTPYHELMQKRMKNSGLLALRKLEYAKADVDFSPIFCELEEQYLTCPCNERGFRNLINEVEKKRREVYIQNKEKFMADPIDQSLLLMALHEDGKTNDILAIPTADVLSIGPYHYYLGMIYSKQKQPFSAIEHFCAFLKEANHRSYNKYPQECDWGIRNAYQYIFNNYNEENIVPEEFAELYITLYEQRNMEVVPYNSRKRVHNFLPKVADQLAEISPKQALKCLQLYAKWEHHYNIRERNDQINALKRDIASLRGARIYRLGQAIKHFVNKFKGGIRCVQEHGWKYTIHRAGEHLRNYLKRYTAWKIFEVFSEQILSGYNIYSEMITEYGENAMIHIAGGGNGDVYLVLRYYIPYIRKYFPDQTNVLVSLSSSFTQLTDWWQIGASKSLSVDQYRNLIQLYVFAKSININIINHHIAIRHTGILMYLEGIHGINYMEMHNAILFDGLVPDNPPLYGEASELMELFKQNNLNAGKTVVLSPYARSLPTVPEKYWIQLTGRLKNLGLSVCTNTFGEQIPVPDTVQVELPFCKMEQFLNMAGYLVSLRSGTDDITHDSTCTRVEVYAEKTVPRSYVASAIEVFTYSNQPVVVSGENIEVCVEETLSQLGFQPQQEYKREEED